MSENTSIRWIAGLSNGETLIEGMGVCTPDTKMSAWAKLQWHLKRGGLTINSFGLWVGERHYNLPSNKPKFNGLVPSRYNCYRTYSGDILSGDPKSEEYICAEAIYDGYKVQLWIDMKDNLKSWINILTN